MYPPVLLLHPDIALQLLKARLRVVEQAKTNAELNGMKGTQFPWEQCVTGKLARVGIWHPTLY